MGGRKGPDTKVRIEKAVMERTIPPANSEPSFDTHERFQIHDGATKKTFAVRDATDDQLAAAFASCHAAWTEQMNACAQAVQRFGAMQGTLAIIEYEMDRRRRTLTIARELPRS
jgi:hypothetical protein